MMIAFMALSTALPQLTIFYSTMSLLHSLRPDAATVDRMTHLPLPQRFGSGGLPEIRTPQITDAWVDV